MIIQSWFDATRDAFLGLWKAFIAFSPSLIGAVLVFGIGWFISLGIGRVVTEVLKKMNFNKVFDKENWRSAMEKADIRVDPSGFIGAIVKWIFVIVFLLAAVEILGLTGFAGFLSGILAYLPNVLVAALMFVVTVIVVDIVEKVIRAWVESMKLGYGHIISSVIKWAIWIVAIFAILAQLNIATLFTGVILTGLVATMVLIFGLSFGLGGKEVAAEILQDLKKRIR